jgi:ankyrin repeat protein
MELFLKRGADVDAIDKKKQTPLLRAVLCGKTFGTIDFLLNHGANPNYKDCGYGEKTILCKVAERNDIPLIELFLKHEAHSSENWAENCYSGLVTKSRDTNITATTVEFLLTRGADPNLKDDIGRTMLHRAAAMNRVNLIEILLKHGANIDATTATRMSPLMYAAQRGSCEAVELLLRRGADANIVNDFGKTACTLCTKEGNKDTCNCATNLKNAEKNPSQFIDVFC